MPSGLSSTRATGKRDFAADFKAHLDEFVIHEYEKKMPFRLIDTYTGLILHRSQVTTLLKQRSDYEEKLWGVASESIHIPDPEGLRLSMGPKLESLDTFIREYLAFAMFSHRWRVREITIEDVRGAFFVNGIYSVVHAPPHLSADEANDYMAGVKKLQEFCCTVAKCGYRWAWADTCCIDGEVFGERSESINSMFLWYRSSDLTIVYLDDVEDVKKGSRIPAIEGDHEWLYDEQIQDPFSSSYPSHRTSGVITLSKCCRANPRILLSTQPDTQIETATFEAHIKANFPSVSYRKAHSKHTLFPEWLTRGWTLQETLASKRLRFYSNKWALLEGDHDAEDNMVTISISSFKFRARLHDHRAFPIWRKALEDTTGISRHDLLNFQPGTKDVRTRLHWVTKRRTTKDEDIVYCMLGIFDISLPVFYGEGDRAFFRLQEEILKRTGDVSLFDWFGPSSSINSLLACSPACFAEPNLHVPGSGTNSTTSAHQILENLTHVENLVNHIRRLPLPCHTLVNGEMDISLFEHQVQRCEYLNNSSPNDTRHLYRLEADGLCPTVVTLASPVVHLVNNPTQYCLCRLWNRDAYGVFSKLPKLTQLYTEARDMAPVTAAPEAAIQESDMSLLDTIATSLLVRMAVMVTALDDVSGKARSSSSSSLAENVAPPTADLTVLLKRMEPLNYFFQDAFPVYLIRIKDGHRIRVNTIQRTVARYARFDFTMPVTRLIS